jgi:hypothetical protein
VNSFGITLQSCQPSEQLWYNDPILKIVHNIFNLPDTECGFPIVWRWGVPDEGYGFGEYLMKVMALVST